MWFKDHNPFNPETDLLISIATGVVADDSINCDSAEDVGKISISKMIGQDFASLKLKRSDKVKTLSYLGPCVKIREELMPVDSNLLFMRITFVMKTENDFQKYLKYELAPTPPSLFRDTMMRKTDKSSIGDLLPSRPPSQDEELSILVSSERAVVVDGGMLLRKVVWPRPSTYQEVCQSYVRYVCTHYNSNCTVVFDGYSTVTTKEQEQLRRVGKRTSAKIIVEGLNMVTVSQADFLSNRSRC